MNLFLLAHGVGMGSAGVIVVATSQLVHRIRVNTDSVYRSRVDTESVHRTQVNTDTVHTIRVRAR